MAVTTGRWQTTVGGLPTTFWYLWAGSFVNRLGAAVGPFLALYLTGARDVGTAEAGLVLTAFGLGSALSQPVGGVLADRVGRRPTMILSLVGAAAMLVAVGASTSLQALAASVFAYGFALDLVRPALSAAVADVVADRDRPRAYALNFWAINLGFSVAVPLGGWLADQGFVLLFALDAATSLAFAVVVVLRVPETRPPRLPGAPPSSMRHVLTDRILLALVVCIIGQAAVYLQAYSTVPIVVADDGLGASGYGVVLALNGVLIVALQPFVLGVLSRRGRAPLLLVAGVLQGGGIALHGLADEVLGHMGAVVVWTVGEILQAGLLGSLVAAMAPPHLRGRYLGVFGTAFGVAGFLAPLVGTQALEHLGQGVLFVGCAVVGGASAVGLAAVSAAASRAAEQRGMDEC